MNYFAHIIPTVVFFNIFFSYNRFVIEKYFEIDYKKKDTFFYPTFKFFNFLLYVITFFGAFVCFFLKFYYEFNILGACLICLLSFILGFFYLYFCIKMANFFSAKSIESAEIKEKDFIQNRVTFIFYF